MRDSIGRSGGHARRIRLFTVRTLREILRDPLSFVICLGVPLVLLVAMYALFSPTEPWFTLDMLTPGIAVFSGAFAMLYMALLVSRDRATWFLTRLYSSPLTDGDFVLGYALPGILIGAGQLVICWAASAVTGLVAGETAWLGIGILPAVLSALPMVVCFVFIGILSGSLFSDKAAPGLSSVVISGAGFLSGAWMPVESLSGGFRTFCAWLPFYPAVRAGRAALAGNALTGDFGIAVFSGAFAMLYMALLVSRDRATWFLTRLYSSPLTDGDFVLGYALPGILIGAGQLVICWAASAVTGLVAGETAWLGIGILPAVLSALPMVVCFVFIGILSGSLFSDKAAPGLSSVVISGAGFLSGAWMPVESLSGGFRTFCAWLPFYPAVRAGRAALAGNALTGDFWRDEAVVCAYTAVFVIAAVLAFRYKARHDAA